MKKLALALASIVAMLAVPAAVTPAPANSAIMTDVTHAANDTGWTSPIHIVCHNGTHRYLNPGESSFMSVKACDGLGVDRIIVGSGHTVRCSMMLPPYGWKTYYVGSTDVPSYASLQCYDQKAL